MMSDHTDSDAIAAELDLVRINQHGDSNNWQFLGRKIALATGIGVCPGDKKIYEIFLDEFGKQVEWHYWIRADGTKEGGKLVYPSTTVLP